MAGTLSGGKAAAKTIKAKYGPGFYKRIGALGGRASDPRKKPFSTNRNLAIEAGRKGGMSSKRAFTPEQREAARIRLHEGKRRKAYREANGMV